MIGVIKVLSIKPILEWDPLYVFTLIWKSECIG